MKSKENDLNLIFLNTPISDKCQDVIGMGKYIEKLNSAIDAGAQMIAVTSPFGSGKSSISELLEQKRVVDRFQGSINTRGFDKCAVVAYLTTAFEHDFYNTNDQAFQKLINLYLQNDLTEENVFNHLKGASSVYIDICFQMR